MGLERNLFTRRVNHTSARSPAKSPVTTPNEVRAGLPSANLTPSTLSSVRPQLEHALEIALPPDDDEHEKGLGYRWLEPPHDLHFAAARCCLEAAPNAQASQSRCVTAWRTLFAAWAIVILELVTAIALLDRAAAPLSTLASSSCFDDGECGVGTWCTPASIDVVNTGAGRCLDCAPAPSFCHANGTTHPRLTSAQDLPYTPTVRELIPGALVDGASHLAVWTPSAADHAALCAQCTRRGVFLVDTARAAVRAMSSREWIALSLVALVTALAIADEARDIAKLLLYVHANAHAKDTAGVVAPLSSTRAPAPANADASPRAQTASVSRANKPPSSHTANGSSDGCSATTQHSAGDSHSDVNHDHVAVISLPTSLRRLNIVELTHSLAVQSILLLQVFRAAALAMLLTLLPLLIASQRADALAILLNTVVRHRHIELEAMLEDSARCSPTSRVRSSLEQATLFILEVDNLA